MYFLGVRILKIFQFVVLIAAFMLITVDARAVTLGDQYNIVGPTSTSIDSLGLPEVRVDVLGLDQVEFSALRQNPLLSYPKQPSSAFFSNKGRVANVSGAMPAYTLDLEANPNYWGDLANTRITNVYSLEDIVETILRFKLNNPESTPWAVFDLDEMLTISANRKLPSGDEEYGKIAIHPKTNELLRMLRDADIPVALLSMATGAVGKLTQAGVVIDGVFDPIIDNVRGNGGMKGAVLKEYITSLAPDRPRPSHIFFSDDSLEGGFIESVENSMAELHMPFTTFHFIGGHVISAKDLSHIIPDALDSVESYLMREAKHRGLTLASYKQKVIAATIRP